MDWSDYVKEYVDNIEKNICGRYIADIIEFVKSLEGDKPLTILDVACGPGSLSIELARRGHTVYAIDYAVKMIEILENRLKLEENQELKITPLVMDGMTLEGIKNDSMDVVVSNFGVFSFPDRKKGWKAINRVLKPKIGKLITTTWDTRLSLDQTKNNFVPSNTNPACFHNGYTALFNNADDSFSNVLATDDWHTLSNPDVFKNEVMESTDSGYNVFDVYNLQHSITFQSGDYYMEVFKSGPHLNKMMGLTEKERKEMKDRVLKTVTNDPSRPFCVLTSANLLYALKA